MQSKLKLDLEQLSVESFDTSRPQAKRGTVFGEQCTCDTACTCPGCPTCAVSCNGSCDPSCPATCLYSCDDVSCLGGDTCGYTCDDACTSSKRTDCDGICY